MKNGYYLSCYIEFDSIGNIYEYARRHDQNIALWKVEERNVELVHYWELERLTGFKKNQVAFYNLQQFESIINQILRPYDISLENIEKIYGTPELNGSDDYLSIKKYPKFTYHTMCHLASCLYMDMNIYKNEKILAFSVDGGSDIVVDKEAMTRQPFVGCYSDNCSKKMELNSVFSPAVLWDYMSSRYEMQEGSLMALASASDSIAYYVLDDILINHNNTVSINSYEQIDKMINYIESLSSLDEGINFNYFDKRFSSQENKISMVMKIIQKMSCNIMEKNIDELIRTYHINTEEVYLAMSGGFALNCPCNTYLMKRYNFKGFIAPPCVSDSGMALGIGLYTFSEAFDRNFEFCLKDAYYGDADNLDAFLKKGTYSAYIESLMEFNPAKVVKDIKEGLIIWFDGQAEIGPRALGARSIIGDARKKETKDKLNIIKKRQWWRPVAPIILKEKIGEWFEESFESPYMLHAFKLREEKRQEVIAIAHDDGSARLQSISCNDSKNRLLNVVEEFYKSTGVPIICNTSLNDKGEPIINRIEEAINFALRKDIKIVYINGTRLQLKNHHTYAVSKPLERPLRIQIWNNNKEFQKYVDLINPLHVSADILFFYTYFKLKNLELLKSKKEVRKLKIRTRLFLNGLSPFIQADIDKYCNLDYKSKA